MQNQDYLELFGAIKEIVDKFDPMGLLSGGAPSDEYNDEIQKILSALINAENKENFEKEVKEIFKKSFNNESVIYKNIAKEIYQLKR